MPQPSRSDVHVNRPLTNISIAYIQKAEDFIADKVFPIVPVMKQSDRYFTYDKKAFMTTQAAVRAPGSESAGSGFDIDNTPSYFADVWAVHKDIDDQTRANCDQPLDMDRDATIYVTQQMLLRREITFQKKYMSTGIWSADFTPSNLWDTTSGDPMKDIDKKKSDIKGSTGFDPNTLVMTRDVFNVIKNNAAVLDRIKYTQKGIVTEELLAALFGVKKLLVANAVSNSAIEGEAGVFGFIKTKCALLVYSNESPSIMQPSGGYIFSWQGMFGAGAQGNRVKSFRMEQLESDRVEGEMAFDMKLVSADLGIFLSNVIS